MLTELDTPAGADFSRPMALMSDCHRRIEHFLLVLIRLAEEVPGGDLDATHRESLEQSLNYFRWAAPRHTQDEEQTLFPRLRRCKWPEVQAALAKVDGLEADHRVKEKHHARLEVLGQCWLAEGRLDDAAFGEFRKVLAELARFYQRHIPIEDNEVFPLAEKFLCRRELDEMGREMRERRIQNPGRAGSRCAMRRVAALGEIAP